MAKDHKELANRIEVGLAHLRTTCEILLKERWGITFATKENKPSCGHTITIRRGDGTIEELRPHGYLLLTCEGTEVRMDGYATGQEFAMALDAFADIWFENVLREVEKGEGRDNKHNGHPQ